MPTRRRHLAPAHAAEVGRDLDGAAVGLDHADDHPASCADVGPVPGNPLAELKRQGTGIRRPVDRL
jgi:hypothetical protein